MATKKITLNELRRLVKQVINESLIIEAEIDQFGNLIDFNFDDEIDLSKLDKNELKKIVWNYGSQMDEIILTFPNGDKRSFYFYYDDEEGLDLPPYVTSYSTLYYRDQKNEYDAMFLARSSTGNIYNPNYEIFELAGFKKVK